MNNNSAKATKTPEPNDDDDVETAPLNDTESLIPQNIENNNLAQEYPSDPNETEQVSSIRHVS